MKSDNNTDAGSFTLPAQTIHGSREEMLAAINQAIIGLLALRHVVVGDALVMPGLQTPPAANPSRRSIPAPVTFVSRMFSNMMGRRD